MTGFTVSAFLSRNHVSPKEAFEGLELCEGKLSCTVLRGPDVSNPVRPLDCTVPPGGRGGRPSPAPTERSVQIFRTTLFRSWFTAQLELANPRRGDTAWVATVGTVL